MCFLDPPAKKTPIRNQSKGPFFLNSSGRGRPPEEIPRRVAGGGSGQCRRRGRPRQETFPPCLLEGLPPTLDSKKIKTRIRNSNFGSSQGQRSGADPGGAQQMEIVGVLEVSISVVMRVGLFSFLRVSQFVCLALPPCRLAAIFLVFTFRCSLNLGASGY